MKKIIIILALFFVTILQPIQPKAAETLQSSMTKDINKYLGKNRSLVTLKYRNLATGETLSISSSKTARAASTIKLPLALYIVELADQHKINLSEKLTYQKRHYYGGSGVIQKAKVGTRYTIKDLLQKAMVHSDNIAFIMLREKVGKQNFIKYMKSIGGTNAYPNNQNLTSPDDLIIYTGRLYKLAETSSLAQQLVEWLKHTDYNTTIPKGIPGVQTAHKVGMIPDEKIYNDTGIVYQQMPYALSIMTRSFSYEKSQKVIADLAAIINKYHVKANSGTAFTSSKNMAIYKNNKGTFSKIGELNKGELFSYSKNYNPYYYEILSGGEKVYIKKIGIFMKQGASTKAVSERVLGKISLLGNTPVSALVSGKMVNLGSLAKGQTFAYVGKDDKLGYSVLLGGRVGYIPLNLAKKF
ncbi:serine hydrolase [Peribacillus kribbensis]|uniref:serine hydrolase n=1 Tax=Peribacillus kribbensis TaxID=356658 RepID=UPI000418D1BC|nr:serine hydrolase [Peribacillus kribbensis]